MKMAHLGIGAGAFADGFRDGMGLGRDIKGIRSQREIDTIRKDGLGQARELHPDDPAAQTRHFRENTVPRLQQTYLEQGNIEMADGWGDWSKKRENQEYMDNWSNAMRSTQMGDYDAAADFVLKNYHRIDDSIEPLSVRPGEQGGRRGFIAHIRDGKGKERDIFVGRDELVQQGLFGLNPQAMFELEYQQMTGAQQAAAEAARDDVKHQRTLQRDSFQHGQKIELETIREDLRDARSQREFDRNVSRLRQAGYSDEFLNRALPSLLGVDTDGPYRKGPSPEEIATMLYRERLSKIGFERLSESEQRQILEQDMRNIMDAMSTIERDRGSSEGSRRPQIGQQRSGQQGVPELDTQTGEIIYR